MTHKLTLAGNVNEYFTAESLAGREFRRAGDFAVSSPVNAQWSLPPETIVAWVSLLMIIALIAAHSGYWALLLPSWLALVFMVGASAPVCGNSLRSPVQGGSL